MGTQFETDLEVDILSDIQEPELYNVIFLNDDYTPMEFVIAVLIGVFNLEIEDAYQITIDVHNNGKAIVAQYVKEIADTKKKAVDDISQANKHPLQCIIQKAPQNTSNNKPKI